MTEAAPTGLKRWGFRYWKRWLLGLCMLPFLGFGVSNVGLGSPWGRHWLAGKIHSRCGLPVTVDGASWSPWRGLTLTDIRILPPPGLQSPTAEPLLQVASVCLVPNWRAGLHRHLQFRSLTVERPRLVVTVEMLAHLARQLAQAAGPVVLPQPVQQPPVAVNEIPPGLPPQGPHVPPPTAPVAPPAPAVPVAPVAGPSHPTGWLHLHAASCQLVASNAPQPLLRVDDVSGDIPLAGDAAKSEIRLGNFEVRGQSLISELTAQLSWQSPMLMVEPTNTSYRGVALRLAAKVGLLPGLPLLAVVQAPEQAIALSVPPANASVAAKWAVLNARFQGYLLAPGSWQGELIADANTIKVKHGDFSADFQFAHCGSLLRGGMLSCVDARLLSEQLSLLGNATLLVDGRLGGVVRLVAPPERVGGLIQRWFPAQASAAVFTPLSTPQRVAFDLAVLGTFQDPQLQLGQDGPLMPITKHEAPMTNQPP